MSCRRKRGFCRRLPTTMLKSLKQACADYHDDMKSEVFEGWFKKILLPNLPQNSVIVSDNASYYYWKTPKF